MNTHSLRKIVLAAFALLVFSLPTSADDRYTLISIENGTMRLDRKSGVVSYCRYTGGSVVCSLSADEREAWIVATEDMEDRVEELEKRIAYLEAMSGKADLNNN